MAGATREDLFGLAGTTLDGKFAVHEVVDGGGTSIVYRATQTALGRTVALKVHQPHPDLSERARAQFCQQFEREARTLASLAHPQIVQAIDFGVAQMPSGDRTPWMALEWLDGPTLATLLRDDDPTLPRDPAGVLAVVRPVFEALSAAHAASIAHRDVKPSNIASTRRADGERTFKLLDFGISKPMIEGEGPGSGHTHTTAATLAFTLGYASPEQVGGSRTGPWTDVHAMALVVTEILTRRRVYSARDRAEIAAEVLAPVRPTPARFGLDVGAWEPVLARALSLRPADRFANARELLTALEDALPAARTPAQLRDTAGTMAGASRDATVTTPGASPSRRRTLLAVLTCVGLIACALAAMSLGHRTDPRPASRPVAPVAPAVSAPVPVVPAQPPVVVPAPVAPVAPPVVHHVTRPRTHRSSRPDRVRIHID